MDTFDLEPTPQEEEDNRTLPEEEAAAAQPDILSVASPFPTVSREEAAEPEPLPETIAIPLEPEAPGCVPELEPQPAVTRSAEPVMPDGNAAPVTPPPPRKPGKPSPYANSPYVLNQPRSGGYQYTPQPRPVPQQAASAGKKPSFWRTALAAVLVVALVAAGCGLTAFAVNLRWQQQANAMDQRLTLLQQQLNDQQARLDPQSGGSSPLPSTPVYTGDAMSPAEVYARNVNSVVAISVTTQSYSYGQVVEGASSGSGFVLTEDGYIVTNYHVVEGGTSIAVVMHDDTELAAQVVGYDAGNDIAVLKVEANSLPAVITGSSSALSVGDMVVAIGNPLGELNATQTVGYICGKDREVTTGGTIINMLQADAAINPGNSGGPLFNMYGQVVGITTAKYSGTTSSGASIEGIGFAIPLDDVMGIIEDLKVHGYVTGAYLGITVQNVSEEVTSAYGITGALVRSVEPGYAADRAGIRAKDIIVGVNDTQIESMTDLTRALRGFQAGDTITVTLIRGGERMRLEVTLDERPRDLDTQAQPVPEPGEGEMPSEGDFDEWYDYFRRYFGE